MADGRVEIDIDADASSYEQKLAGIKQSTAARTGEMSKAVDTQSAKMLQSLSNIGGAVESVGTTMSVAITAPVVAAAGASYKLASDFESSMSRVAGALDVPVSSISDLRDLAIQTGQDTIFSASEAGAAMEELAKGGLTSADIKGGALKTTMDLAAAGGLQLADAANTVVQSMGAFGLSADQTGEAANALAGAAAASSADVSDLTQGLSQVSAQAHSAGWSIQDTAAVLGGFADAGIKGSDAGTSLKTMLQSLAAPTDKAADLVADLGLEVRDSNGNMKDAAGIAEELQNKLGGLSSAQKDAAMQTIFGSDASRAALVMTNLGRAGIEKYTAATNDQEAAQRLADSQMGDSERALENMKGAVETAAITIGTELAPVVTDIANGVSDAAEAFGEMDETQQKALISTIALVAGIGPALTIIGKLMGSVKTVKDLVGDAATLVKGFGGEAASAAPSIGDAADKAGSLGTNAEAAGTKAEVASGKLSSFAKKAAILGTAAYTAAEGTRTMFSWNADAHGRFSDAAEGANAYAQSLGTVDANADGVIDANDLVAQALDGASEKFEDGSSTINGFVGWMDKVDGSTKGAAGALNDYMGVTEDNVSHAMRNITTLTQQGWGSALAATQSTGGQMTDETKTQALAMVDAIGKLPPKYQEYGDEAMRGLAASMAPYWPELADYSGMSAQQIASIIKEKLTGTLSSYGEEFQLTGQTTVEQIASGLSFAANGGVLDETTAGIIQKLIDGFKSENLTPEMQGVGTEAMRNLASGMAAQWPELANYANMSGDEIIAAISARLSGSYQVGSDSMTDLGSGISVGSNTVTFAAGSVAEQVYSALTGKDYSETGAMVTQGMADGIKGDLSAALAAAGLGDDVIAKIMESLDAHSPSVRAKTAGATVPAGMAQGISGSEEADTAASSLGESVISTLLGLVTGAFVPGSALGGNFASGVGSQKDNANSQGAITMTGAVSGLDSGDGATPGSVLGSLFAGGVGGQASNARSQGASTAGSASAGLWTGDGSSPGSTLGSLFANGVGGQSGNARSQGSGVADAAAGGMQSNSSSSWSWGAHLVRNFANGISGMVSWATSAAMGVANAVANILGHTVAKEGPLHVGGKGERAWGEHLVENIIGGMRSKHQALSSEAETIASLLDLGDETAGGVPGFAATLALATPSASAYSVTNYYYAIDGVDISGDPAAQKAAETLWSSVRRQVRMR